MTESDILSEQCPDCGAVVGRPCVDQNDVPLTEGWHVGRRRLYERGSGPSWQVETARDLPPTLGTYYCAVILERLETKPGSITTQSHYMMERVEALSHDEATGKALREAMRRRPNHRIVEILVTYHDPRGTGFLSS